MLQRDVSLTRRIFTWLLGTPDRRLEQEAYFQQHGLDLLRAVLESDLRSTSLRSQAIKVFVALLDKPEIGVRLSAQMALPSLTYLLTVKTTIDDKEARNAALAMYQAIDPMITWGQMYRRVDRAVREQDGQVKRLCHGEVELILQSVIDVGSVINRLPLDEAETQSLHCPLLLDWILSGSLVGFSAVIFIPSLI